MTGPGPRDEAGSMLVELIVGMLLMTVVGTLVLNGIVSGFRGQRDLQVRGAALAEARQAVQRVTRDIREANPVLAATRSSLTVQSATNDGGTVQQSWYLSTTGSVTTLMQKTHVVSAAGVASPDVTSPVISGLDPSTVPFDYVALTGWTPPAALASSVDAASCVIAGTSPTAFEGQCLGTVSLKLRRLITGHAPVEVDATVDLRNNE